MPSSVSRHCPLPLRRSAGSVMQQGILYRARTPELRSTGSAKSRHSLQAALNGAIRVRSAHRDHALAGCARGRESPRCGPRRVGGPSGSDLTGTWVGSYGWPGGSYWSDDGACTLQIDGDGTSRAVVTPAPGRQQCGEGVDVVGDGGHGRQSRHPAQLHGPIGDPRSGRGPALRDGPRSHRGGTDYDLPRARSHCRPDRPSASALGQG